MISRCIKYSVVIFGEWKGIFSLKLHHEKKKKMKRQVKPMKIMQFTWVTIGVLELCCTTLVADKIRTMVTSFSCRSSQKYQGWDKWQKDQRVFQGKGVLYQRSLCVPCLFSDTSGTDALENMGPRMLPTSPTSLSSFGPNCSWSHDCVFQLQAASLPDVCALTLS